MHVSHLQWKSANNTTLIFTGQTNQKGYEKNWFSIVIFGIIFWQDYFNPMAYGECSSRGQNRVANLLILFKSNIHLYTLQRKIANGCHLVSPFPLSLFVLVCAFFLAEEQTGVSQVQLWNTLPPPPPAPSQRWRYLRLHFLQQVPSTCTGSESSEQLAGGQKILRHSTTPFCQEIYMLDVNLTTCKTGTQAPGI